MGSLISEDINRLVAELSLDEKARLCIGADFWHTVQIDRVGLPAIRVVDGPHGVRYVGNELRAIDSLPATCFPTGSALAATWDRSLLRRVGAALAQEVQARGCHVLLGPAINIQRSPLCGRHFEYLSEDPCLNAGLATAYIEGLQGEGVGACVKHFACNNSETQRLAMDSQVDPRALREIYLPAFEAAVKEAGAWSVMSGYNKVNGTAMSEHRALLRDVLKSEWGFNGPIISDWYAVADQVAAARAGLDLEMPGGDPEASAAWRQAVLRGDVDETQLDDRLRRLLGLIVRAQNAREGDERSPEAIQNEHDRLARQAASEAIVLLKNERQTLPLNPAALRSIAVIGPLAGDPVIQGHGSSRVAAHHVWSIEQGLRERLAGRTIIQVSHGCSPDGSLPLLTSDHVFIDQTLREHGWVCRYYANRVPDGLPVATRREHMIRMRRGSEVPTELATTEFSVSWTGFFDPPRTGRYVFGLSNNGLARLRVGHDLVVDQWRDEHVDSSPFHAPTLAAIDLRAHVPVPLCVEYRRNCELNFSIQFGCLLPATKDAVDSAVASAAAADVALVCVGLAEGFETEGSDRPDLMLTGQQDALVHRIAQVNPNTIVVVISGAPVDMRAWLDDVPAVLQAWYGGQEQGRAVADVLFGQVNPSGKLPVTFPRRLEDTPAFLSDPGENGVLRYAEGLFVGYRHYDRKDVAPAFPFGHGLSYTTFAYSEPTVEVAEDDAGPLIHLSVRVTNTGDCTGSEVVQLYLQDRVSGLARPVQELKGFDKVSLASGASQVVQFRVGPRALAFFDPLQDAWIVEAGEFEARFASSSRDVRQRVDFTVARSYRLDVRRGSRWTSGPPRPIAAIPLRDLLADPQSRAEFGRHQHQIARSSKLFWLRDYSLDQMAEIDPRLIPADVRARLLTNLERSGVTRVARISTQTQHEES